VSHNDVNFTHASVKGVNGGADFVVVFPEVISSLISKIRDNGNEELVVGIEEVMPEQMTEYLLRVLNTNRFTNSQFRFRQILEDPITKEGLYQVLGEQLRGMDIGFYIRRVLGK